MNKKVRNIQTQILSKDWSTLTKLTYEYEKEKGIWETHIREAYDRGDGVTILLYNTKKKTVILTKQFRIPTYLNGHSDGMMVEACAGKLDVSDPEECIIREVKEETGIEIDKVQKIFDVYMSPGSVTEKIHFYLGEYDDSMKVTSGGGLDSEQENIEVLELSFEEVVQNMKDGKIKDAKTLLLLQYALLHQHVGVQ